MIYVMSDLHGEYDKFIEMLKLIDLKSTDKLYILGDVIDRGPKSLEIIDYIRKVDNIKLLMGNHESFCLQVLLKNNYFDIWFNAGGETTYNQLKERDSEYICEFIKFISVLPKYLIIDNYILVHAGVEIPEDFDSSVEVLMDLQDEDMLLWDREFITSDKTINGYTVVCGHTPTMMFSDKSKKASITHLNGKILIDCGAHFSQNRGRLGCLRLDDMKEFYIG